MTISNATGQPYIAASDPAQDVEGEWFSTYDVDEMTISGELNADGGTIDGYVYAEITADKAHAVGISRVRWDFVPLHTEQAEVALSADGLRIEFTAAGNATFTLSFKPGPAQMRIGWHADGVTGAGGNESITLVTQGNDR